MELGVGLALNCVKAFVKENFCNRQNDPDVFYVSSFQDFKNNRLETSFFNIDKRIQGKFKAARAKFFDKFPEAVKIRNRVVNFLNKPVKCSLLKSTGKTLSEYPKTTKCLKILLVAYTILGLGASVISPPVGILMSGVGLGSYGFLKIAENSYNAGRYDYSLINPSDTEEI